MGKWDANNDNPGQKHVSEHLIACRRVQAGVEDNRKTIAQKPFILSWSGRRVGDFNIGITEIGRLLMRPACYDNGWIKTNIEIYLGNQLTIKKFEKEA